jgi:hypothetical protein
MSTSAVSWPGSGAATSFAGIGAAGRYSDKPTITYQPLAGDKFTRCLLVPIPIPGILFLIQSGYPADFVLRCCVNSINGLQNSYGGAGRLQAGDPKFRELISAMQEAQAAGGMVMRMKTIADKQTAILFLRPSTDEAIAAPVRRIRELLALNPSAGEFNIVYGTYPKRHGDHHVEPVDPAGPDQSCLLFRRAEADLAEGSVYGVQRTPEQEQLFPPLINVRCGPSAPGNAYVSVQYRNQWFWIEDRDIKSKQMFNFTMFLFSLTETRAEQAAPIVTIPAR